MSVLAEQLRVVILYSVCLLRARVCLAWYLYLTMAVSFAHTLQRREMGCVRDGDCVRTLLSPTARHPNVPEYATSAAYGAVWSGRVCRSAKQRTHACARASRSDVWEGAYLSTFVVRMHIT